MIKKKKSIGLAKKFGIFYTIFWKNSNQLFGQPNRMSGTQSDGGEGKDRSTWEGSDGWKWDKMMEETISRTRDDE